MGEDFCIADGVNLSDGIDKKDAGASLYYCAGTALTRIHVQFPKSS